MKYLFAMFSVVCGENMHRSPQTPTAKQASAIKMPVKNRPSCVMRLNNSMRLEMKTIEKEPSTTIALDSCHIIYLAL